MALFDVYISETVNAAQILVTGIGQTALESELGKVFGIIGDSQFFEL